MMRALKERGFVKKVHPTEATCDPRTEIVLGDFVDIEKPTYNEVFETLTKRAGVAR